MAELTEEELLALIERDPTAALCHVIREAGLTMTLYGKPVSESELRGHAEKAATKRILNAIETGAAKTMKTKKKLNIVYQVKVDLCDEFKCCFFHAGIMGSLRCTVADRDTRNEQGKKPPDWCPLRTNPIKVTL
jgi:hypothetical protein